MEDIKAVLTSPPILLMLIILTFFLQVMILRWVFKVNVMIENLERINRKLRLLCEEKGLMTKTEIDK